MKSYTSTRCLLFGASTPYFRAVSRKKGQIKEADQRRKVRSGKPMIRATTKKPPIRGPNKIKNQHGSEDAVSLVRVSF
jgi:hypothetical protein